MIYQLRFNLYGEWHTGQFPSDNAREQFIDAIRRASENSFVSIGKDWDAAYFRPSAICAYQKLTP